MVIVWGKGGVGGGGGGKILKQGKESNLGTLQAIKISSTVNGTYTDDNS